MSTFRLGFVNTAINVKKTCAFHADARHGKLILKKRNLRMHDMQDDETVRSSQPRAPGKTICGSVKDRLTKRSCNMRSRRTSHCFVALLCQNASTEESDVFKKSELQRWALMKGSGLARRHVLTMLSWRYTAKLSRHTHQKMQQIDVANEEMQPVGIAVVAPHTYCVGLKTRIC